MIKTLTKRQELIAAIDALWTLYEFGYVSAKSARLTKDAILSVKSDFNIKTLPKDSRDLLDQM